jgi:hypothetical protein
MLHSLSHSELNDTSLPYISSTTATSATDATSQQRESDYLSEEGLMCIIVMI